MVSMWSAALLPLVVWYTVRLGEVGTVCPAPSVYVSGCVELSVEQSMTVYSVEGVNCAWSTAADVVYY